jgi:5-methylcytosine-specific restriction endonuclease McrA
MQKSCGYCGRIHEESFVCPQKPMKKKKLTQIVRFRNGQKWQQKRRQIKKRDHFLCQICKRDLYDTKIKYNHRDLQVHHAISLLDNENLRLENSNLITLCPMHHTMCDRADIPYSKVREIIDEQMR